MNIFLEPISAPFNLTLKVPASKSLTNRALILSAMAGGTSSLHNILISDDTLSCINALTACHVDVAVNATQTGASIIGCASHFKVDQAVIACRQSGTVARFMSAICATQKGEFTFDAHPQLAQRPIQALLHLLVAQGAHFTHGFTFPYTLYANGLTGGSFRLSDFQSSQFVSALLMAAPLARHKTELIVDADISFPYVKMTIAMMAQFGIEVLQIDQRFIIIPGVYQCSDYTIEPDASTASYFLAAAAMCQSEILIPNLHLQHTLQGDIRFLKILQMMGVEVTQKPQGILVRSMGVLRGIDVDMRECSDTFMTIAILAVFAQTPTRIMNIAHTRAHESDRISVVSAELKKCGIETLETHSSLTIYPGNPHGALIDTHQDHRIAMAFSLLGLKVNGMIISGAECASKTCPTYFELLSQTGCGVHTQSL